MAPGSKEYLLNERVALVYGWGWMGCHRHQKCLSTLVILCGYLIYAYHTSEFTINFPSVKLDFPQLCVGGISINVVFLILGFNLKIA